MYRACIAIVDATRARLFSFERTAGAEGPHDELSEHTDLVNPARRHPGGHANTLDAEFARAIVAAIERELRATSVRRLIVCASPKMLGELRGATPHAEGLVIDELPRDLVKLTAPQIRDQLASHGLLPPRAAAVSA